MNQRFDYLVIGNSAGGIGCVEMLRDLDPSGTTAVISEEAHHVYSRALLPYYLSGKIDREKMYYRPPDFYEQMGVATFLGKRVLRVDFSEKEVELDTKERIRYGKLLLATGGKPFIPSLEGLEKKNVFTFLTMEDVLRIEKALKNACRVVVLGGGVIGLMAAEVFRKRGLEVHVLELAERVLAPVVDEAASEMVEAVLRENSVEIHTKNTARKITGGDFVESVILTDEVEIPCDMLILSVGVVPRVELVEGTGIKINKGIMVNKRMQTSLPDVYACGDCAEAYDFVTGGERVVPLWPNAYVGGRIAACNMAGRERKYEWGTSMNSMHFFDLNIITAGLNVSRDQQNNFEIIDRLDKVNKVYRKFTLQDGKLIGMILAGKICRAGIFVNLMRSKIDVSCFGQELLNGEFGYLSIPEELRWELLKDDVILGVVGDQ
jgi:NAD(P)H-nitrite reductase large subunit